MRAVFPWVAVALMGCGQNAVLEVTVELPGAMDSRTFVQFQARENAGSFAAFERNWGVGGDPSPLLLLESVSQADEVSVVSSDATENDLNIRLAFCDHPACETPDGDPAVLGEAWFTVEHPFYPGERTFILISVDPTPVGPPAGAVFIPRCDVQGCVSGPPLGTGYCEETPEAPHFCEL